MTKKLFILGILLLVSIPAFAQSIGTAWVKRYTGTGNGQDQATAITGDDSGYVYVTGNSRWRNQTDWHYTTIKYYPNGDTAWVRIYGGSGEASNMVVDLSGNVYVTGNGGTLKYDHNGNLLWVEAWTGTDIVLDNSDNIYVTGGLTEYTTVKFRPNGDTVWVRKYKGPGINNQEAHAVAVDDSGNVYVTGGSWSGIYSDFATIKYYPNGDTAWVRRYDAGYSDEAFDIAVDGSGNVYVTGNSNDDYLTIKYDQNGGIGWIRVNSEGFAPCGIVVDSSHNVYVTGFGYVYSGKAGYYDWVTVKYYPNGSTHWVKTYNTDVSGDDKAYDIALDALGNIYVVGSTHLYWSNPDYAIIKYDSLGNKLMEKKYNGPADSTEWASRVFVKSNGEFYVTGSSIGVGSFQDYATIKYYPNGDTAWVRRYNGPGASHDYPNAIAVDDSGYVYITGGSYGSATYADYGTIKYSPNGDTAWVRRYNGPGSGYDYAYAIAVDGAGNVYIAGECAGVGTSTDYATIKYYSNGDTAWVRRYNGPGNGIDQALSMAVDDSGYSYVTGSSYGGFTNNDYATIKYYPNGDTVWVRRYNGPGNGNDKANALYLDTSGNVYVTGQSEGVSTKYDYATIKYYANGDTAWVRRHGGNYDDLAKAIIVDGLGYVYVTGYIFRSSSDCDYLTLRYYPTGEEIWAKSYSSVGVHADVASDIAIDQSGNVYVTGGANHEYCTIKYNPWTGGELWSRKWWSGSAAAITLDDSSNVYVTGCLWSNFFTIKYTTDGDTLWTITYDGPALEYDEATAMAIDVDGNVYITGYSDGGETGDDYATIKYVQTGAYVVDETGNREKPSEFSLFQNYPNPFNPATNIEFQLSKSGQVKIEIFNILGQKVRTLVDQYLKAGYKLVDWDGKDNSGNDVSSGIYFFRLQAGEFAQTKKMVLLR
jgi:uncharacterized delta-60 repeat protein